MADIMISTDTRYPVNRRKIRSAIEDTLAKRKVMGEQVEVSVSVVGSRKMTKLTNKFLEDNKKHSVLAFALEDVAESKSSGFVNPPNANLILGDIVLCWPQVLLDAARDDIMVDEEVYNLCSHATDHLLGYHHN